MDGGPYWKNVEKVAQRQRLKGLSTYGTGIECNHQDIVTRLDMLEEELVDVLFYMEWVRDWVQQNGKKI